MGRLNCTVANDSRVWTRPLIAACVAAVSMTGAAHATTLDFDLSQNPLWVAGSPIDQAYGDHVTGTGADAPYTYDLNPDGPTPDIALTYGPDVVDGTGVHPMGFGDLGEEVIRVNSSGDGVLRITLKGMTPTSGPRLIGFDLAATKNGDVVLGPIGPPTWAPATGTDSRTINAIRVLDANDQVIHEQLDVVVMYGSYAGSWTPTPEHTSIDLSGLGLQDSELTIEIDASNLNSDAKNIGLDNLAYSQAVVENVPEPTTMGLMALGALAIIRRKR